MTNSMRIAIAIFFCAPIYVAADIVTTTGSIAPPIDPTVNGTIRRGSEFEADGVGNTFAEKQFVSVNAAIVGLDTTGLGSEVDGVLEQGAVVHSYFLFTDPANNIQSNTIETGAGSIVLENPILAVVFDCSGVDATDAIFGLPGVVYENSNLPNFCHGAGGFPNATSGDHWTFSGNTFNLTAFRTFGNKYDSVRILADACVMSLDSDNDGAPDAEDNCALIPNPDQLDTNGDGVGNACDPDLNNDGLINAIDLGLLKSVFFTVGDQDADFNGDGVVNAVDLGIMKLYFFDSPGPSCVAANR